MADGLIQIPGIHPSDRRLGTLLRHLPSGRTFVVYDSDDEGNVWCIPYDEPFIDDAMLADWLDDE